MDPGDKNEGPIKINPNVPPSIIQPVWLMHSLTTFLYSISRLDSNKSFFGFTLPNWSCLFSFGYTHYVQNTKERDENIPTLPNISYAEDRSLIALANYQAVLLTLCNCFTSDILSQFLLKTGIFGGILKYLPTILHFPLLYSIIAEYLRPSIFCLLGRYQMIHTHKLLNVATMFSEELAISLAKKILPINFHRLYKLGLFISSNLLVFSGSNYIIKRESFKLLEYDHILQYNWDSWKKKGYANALFKMLISVNSILVKY